MFSHKKRRIIREMDFTPNLQTTHKSPPMRRKPHYLRGRRSKDQGIWGDLNTPSPCQSNVSSSFTTQMSTLADTIIDDESEDDLEQLENEVFGPESRVNSDTLISDSPTPPEKKHIYSAKETLQFYQQPPRKIKYLKGGLAEELEQHLRRLKSDTSQWLHGRQNYIKEPGKLVKVKQVTADFYGRRIVSYTNHNTGLDYFIVFDANDKQLAHLQVGQRLEFEKEYSKHRVHLKDTVKLDLDFAVTEKRESVCNVLLNVHKIKVHHT
jgi:hypothetical protein